MATIKPLKRQKDFFDVTRYAARTALEQCLYYGGADNSVVGAARPTVAAADKNFARSVQRFVDRTPLVLRSAVTPLAFHHHLHGMNGRLNEQRRPLIVLGAVGKAHWTRGNLSLQDLRSIPSSYEDRPDRGMESPNHCWIEHPANALPPCPLAVTRPTSCGALVVTNESTGPLWEEVKESIYVAVSPVKIHISPQFLRPKEGAAVPRRTESSAASWLALNSGDVLYVPRWQPLWLEPPTVGSLTERASFMRRTDIKPVRLLPQDLDKTEQDRREEALRLSQSIPTVLWRWRFESFPVVAGRSPMYVAASCMGGYGDFYGGLSAS